MSAFYDDAAATAASLLAELGQVVTLTHSAPGAYDPATGTNTVATTAQTVVGVKFEYNTFIRSGVRNDKGTLIQAGDKQLIVAGTATDGTALTPPVANDTATVNGVLYTITAVAPLNPAGTPVYYECNIRGAS